MGAALTAIERWMADARRARAGGDLDAAERLLADAHRASTSLEPDHSMRAIVGWRHLKVLFDLGRVEKAEKVLVDVLELDEPFGEGSGGIRAAEPIARGIWDRLGYGRPSVRTLWARYIDQWEQAGDPWMAACGRAQLLWEWACAGELARVREAVETIACATPSRFARGPSRHPRAPDAAGSLFYAQMDHARTAAWASVWSADEQLARLALELYADALAEAELPEDYWFVESSARAELRFGWPVDALARWEGEARRLDHRRGALHLGLAQAELGADPVASLAPLLPEADDAGPEWGVDARRVLVRSATGDPRSERWAAEADATIEQYGLGVFRSEASPARVAER